MSAADDWILLDRPEPERIRPVLDALRDLPPSVPEDRALAMCAVLDRLDVALDQGARYQGEGEADDEEGEASTEPRPPAAADGGVPLVEAGPTVRSPEPPGPIAPGPPVLATPLAARVAATAPRQVPAEPREETPKPPSAVKAVPKTVPVPVMVPFPRLTLEQYASLCAELAAHPEAAERIAPAYHVPSKPSLAALDAHWGAMLTAKPEVREAFATLVVDFTPCARAQRR